MTDKPAYNSRADIFAHIMQVRDRLDVFATELLRRGSVHDASKFSDAEKPAFDLVTPLLPGVTYGSPEYRALEDRVRPALSTTTSTTPTTRNITATRALPEWTCSTLSKWSATGSPRSPGGQAAT